MPKRIHYMSMEFLLGRTLRNNIMNLAAEPPGAPMRCRTKAGTWMR